MNIEIPKIRTKIEIEVEKLKVQFDELKAENDELKIKNTKLQLLANIKESLFFASVAIVFIILNIQHYIKLEMSTKGDIIEFTLFIVAWSVVALVNTILIISNIITYNNTPPKKQN